MEDKDRNWPAWYYGPNDAAEIFESADDVPAGWVDHPAKVKQPAKAPTAPKAPVDAAKGDGKPAKEKSPLAVAREAYKAKFGKGVSPRLTLDEINAKLAESIDL